MNEFDTGRAPDPDEPEGGPGAAPIMRGTARVNGTPVPRALLVPDAWLPSLFVRVSPAEVSWFAQVPAGEAVQVCREATGTEPRVRHVIDRYFDTPDRALFRKRVSVRLRHYVHPPREIAYEIIAVGWGGHAPGGRLVDGFVQTFERNTADDLPRILERYRAHGYEQVAYFDKMRYTFEVATAHSTDARGKTLVAPEREGVEGARGWLKVMDFGIKVDVDEMRDSPFAEPSIIEVEYDPSRYPQAVPIIDRIRAALPGRLREKEFNKIAHLLSGKM
ncbi:MAG TPA: CYTH domain-containing protein [Longimicrobium sp.]|nr:CYTH domain-containing protein [Longimicrobium sp.]